MYCILHSQLLVSDYSEGGIMSDYGIKIDENEFGKFGVASFGDGLTRVQTMGYGDGVAGIVIVRDGQDVAFAIKEPDEVGNALSVVGEKLILAFDNPKSIDVVIDRLIEAKSFMESDL